MRKTLSCIAITLLMAVALAHAQTSTAKTQPKSGPTAASITGEVIDLACYVGHNMSGKDHVDCAKSCAEKGLPLAILDAKSQQIYLPLGLDHSNPNTKLMKHIGQTVKVTGQVWKKGGFTGIEIKTVDPVAAKPKK